MKYSEGGMIMGICRLILIGFIAGILLYPSSAAAEDLVSGHYSKGIGQEIKIGLEISSPAPPLVIVTQNLPQGTKIISSKPKLKKYAPKKGVAKWLLSKVKSGNMTISLQLDRPVGKGEISGEIRFRNSSGKMVNIALKN